MSEQPCGTLNVSTLEFCWHYMAPVIFVL